MILVDTSIWIDHFRRTNLLLAGLLDDDRVLVHPFVIGEIVLGSLRNRGLVLTRLARLTSAMIASHEEVLAYIEADSLAGTGIGYVDAHLLTSAKLTPGARIWTRDKKLRAASAMAALEMKMN
jgi:predicted nucleic acid-binding protein